MRWRIAVVRAADPNPEHLLVSHHNGTTYQQGYITDDWQVTDELDVWGTSVYLRDFYEVSRKFDWTRSAARGKPWWLSEVSGGRGLEGGEYFYLSDDVKSAAETRSYPLLAFSHGAQASIFWQFRCESFGEESPNFGLTNQAGDPTDRTAAASELACMLDRHATIFDNLQFSPTPVALLWEPRAFSMERVSYWERNKTPIGVLNMAGYHRALTRLGHQVDILHAADVADKGVPPHVRLLIHPYGIIDRPGLAEAITRWVEEGGVFVSSPVTGHYDARGYASPRVPPGAWRSLLGVQQTELRYPTAHTAETDIFTVDLIPDGLTAGIGALSAWRVAEAYALDNGVVPLAVMGEDVVMASQVVGNGRAIACGAFFGAAFEYEARQRDGLPLPSQSLLVLLDRLAAAAGVRPRVSTTGVAFCRTGCVQEGGQLVVFLHNPAEAETISWISVPDLKTEQPVVSLLEDSPVGMIGPGRSLAVRLPARDTRVLLIGTL